MRSTASFHGHPIHPMLIPFPFAFLTGAFLFDLAAVATNNMDLAFTGEALTLAGIGAGLLAAVPGAIDYFGSVPPRSSGRTRATKHALINTTALLLFAVSWLYRDDGEASGVTLGLQFLGLGALSVGGWLGGSLVYSNQIGVEHQYANAGQWKEEHIRSSVKRVTVGRSGELTLNQMKLLHVDGQRIALGCTERGLAAFDDRCTHQGGPLSDGALMCGTVQCPWHGSQFDVHTGEVKAGPAEEKIKTHTVEEREGEVTLLR